MNSPFSPVKEAFNQYLPEFDLQVPEAVLSTRLACYLPTDPVWLLLVGPPSSGKGTTLDPLEGVDNAYFLSKLTPKTFLSGAPTKNGQDPSLLNRLGTSPFIVCKELGTMLSDPHTYVEIFGQMREIHDGFISQDYGTGITRKWKGKACFVMGFTHAIDMYGKMDGILGERFMKLRFEESTDPAALALKAMCSSGTEEDRVTAIGQAYRQALREGRKNLSEVDIPLDEKQKLAKLSAAIACIRTPVNRNTFKRDRVEFHPKSESPARLAKALLSFGMGNAALHCRTEIQDFGLIYRLAFDSMLEPRRSIFINAVLEVEKEGFATRSSVEGVVGKDQTKAVLEDLCLVGALESYEPRKDGTPGRPAIRYKLAAGLRNGLQESGALPWLLSEQAHTDTGVELPEEPYRHLVPKVA